MNQMYVPLEESAAVAVLGIVDVEWKGGREEV
jgi:hypothetical protein